MGRATSGVRIIKLASGDRVVDIARLDEEKEMEIAEKMNKEG
jgi:hypothetical protein